MSVDNNVVSSRDGGGQQTNHPHQEVTFLLSCLRAILGKAS